MEPLVEKVVVLNFVFGVVVNPVRKISQLRFDFARSRLTWIFSKKTFFLKICRFYAKNISSGNLIDLNVNDVNYLGFHDYKRKKRFFSTNSDEQNEVTRFNSYFPFSQILEINHKLFRFF